MQRGGPTPALPVPNPASVCLAKEPRTPKAACAGAGDPEDGQGLPGPGLRLPTEDGECEGGE